MNDQQDKDDIDEFFATLGAQPEAPPYLLQRIVARLPADKPTGLGSLIGLFPTPWRMAVSLLLPLVVGFGMGFGDVLSDEPDYEVETLLFADTLTSETELMLDPEDEY